MEGYDGDGVALRGWVQCTWFYAVSVGEGDCRWIERFPGKTARDPEVEMGNHEVVKILDGQ